MLNGKKIFVTGGTGSWGTCLIKTIFAKYNPAEVVVFSRGEHKQVEMLRMYAGKKITYIIGDVRDYQRMRDASRGVDYFFHMAALKHVPICEDNHEEAIATNINGTINATRCAQENDISNFIFVSTDKAVNPINVYGTTKLMAEKIVIGSGLKNLKTRFVCVRAGNVLGSAGSVVPLFKNQIDAGGPVTLTDGSMTRYLMLLRSPIELIFHAMNNSKGREVFVLKMPSVVIGDLAKVLVSEYGKGKKIQITESGPRPGEKYHEMLMTLDESMRAVDMKDFMVILPFVDPLSALRKHWGTDFINREYNSKNNYILSEGEIKGMLKENGDI